MGMSMNDGDSDGTAPLAEINVTPFVDVMLVLLIIFMVTSSVETIRAEQAMDRLLEQTQVEEIEQAEEHPSQKVNIDLPKVNAEQVNLSEAQKLVLTLDIKGGFWIGDTLLVSCGEAFRDEGKKRANIPTLQDDAFRQCVTKLEGKLLENEKLQSDKELYLRVDETIAYGRALLVMSRIRKAGITKFGLIADPEMEM